MISNVSWGVQKIDKLDFRNNKRKIKLLKVYIYIFLAKKQKKKSKSLLAMRRIHYTPSK